MDVDRLAASTLAFCTICGLRLTVRFCFRMVGITQPFPTEISCCTYFTCDVVSLSRMLLCNAKFPLQLLEGNPFGFRVDEQNDEELKRRHGRKEGEG